MLAQAIEPDHEIKTPLLGGVLISSSANLLMPFFTKNQTLQPLADAKNSKLGDNTASLTILEMSYA
jgi:hypothetical protein